MLATTILEHILNGGYLMWPLMFCSVLVLAVVIDRLSAWMAHRRYDTRSLRAKVVDLMAQGRDREAAVLCSSTPGPVAAVLLAGVQSYIKHRDVTGRPASLTMVMEKAMEDYREHAMAAVGKRLTVLATIGSAAPIIGMTGTVTGMMASFTHLQAAGAGSAEVGGGIAEALTTTATGLLIALMAVIPYNFFTSASDRVELEVKEASTELLDCVATRLGAAAN